MEICRYFVGVIKLEPVPQINHSEKDSRAYFTFAFHTVLGSSQTFELRMKQFLKRNLSHLWGRGC